MTLLLFILATIGLTNILVHGKILDVIGLRQWVKDRMKPEHFEVFECYECTGFWSGLLMSIVFLRPDSSWLIEWVVSYMSHEPFFIKTLCSYVVMGILVLMYEMVFHIACGFAGSVLSQFYSDVLYLIRSHTAFEIEENDGSD